ncbi:MAG: SLC13 family permease [Geminicoccaceae bacterium]
MEFSLRAPAVFAATVILCMVVTLALTTPDQMAFRVAAVCALAIVSFATRILSEVLTSLLCFLAFLALGAAPAEVIFSGFASGGFWLLFSGLIIGAAITQTGLGKQLALRLFAQTGTSYRRAVLLLAFCGLGLGLLVPSTIPRVIVLMPVAVSLAKAMGFEDGSRGQIGLAMVAATSTLLPTYAILTANLPTIVQSGAIEALYGIPPSYGGYFIAQLPVNLVRLAVLLAIFLTFGADMKMAASATLPKPQPMTGRQKNLLALLGIAILFWATDSLHGISPAWIALSATAVLFWPGLDIIEKDTMKSGVDLSPAIFVAGVFAISAVAGHVGLTDRVAGALTPILDLGAGSSGYGLYAISGLSMLLSHLTTAPAAPLVLAPLAEAMADDTGWAVQTVSMAQIIGIATPLLPFQAPPLIVAMAMAPIPAAALTRICLILGAGTLLLGLPLTWLWWQVTGLI